MNLGLRGRSLEIASSGGLDSVGGAVGIWLSRVSEPSGFGIMLRDLYGSLEGGWVGVGEGESAMLVEGNEGVVDVITRRASATFFRFLILYTNCFFRTSSILIGFSSGYGKTDI